MRNLFRRIFNLDKVETLSNQRDKAKCEVESLEFQLRTYKDRIEYLENTLKEKDIKGWKPVKHLEKGKFYYVVSQGGYYPIKANTFLFGIVSEVTRRAVKNGFVVSTREEAEALQKAMRDLVK